MKILLAVSGSISAYKTIDLTRELTKAGHEVRIVASSGALEFTNLNIYSFLGAQEVYGPLDDFKPQNKSVLHVDLAHWSDIFVVCPASANTIAHLAHGFAKDLLQSIFLSMPKNKQTVIFPAMNVHMYDSVSVSENLKKLSSMENVFVHPPVSGELACGDVGMGKLPSVETIFDFLDSYQIAETSVQKNVLITAGATISPLDPVRYLTNPSSGLTGLLLAKTFLKSGYQVQVIAGRFATPRFEHLNENPLFKLTRVVTTEQMKTAVLENFENADIYISPAAINDIQFEQLDEKLGKDQIGQSLQIIKCSDILEEVIKLKTKQRIVGFAAQTDMNITGLTKKWKRKQVDLLVGTKVHGQLNNVTKTKMKGFQSPEAEYLILENGKMSFEGTLSKSELALDIFNRVTQ
jgi:phosphopantothenoylcysteine decarboxylase / phosphopantothenate---cysteine ligase